MSSVSAKLAAAVATNTTSAGYEPTSDPIRQKKTQTRSVIEQMVEGKRKYESPQSHDFRPIIGEKDKPTPSMMKSAYHEEKLFAHTAVFNPGLTGTRTQF